ncbi:MAG TPA: FAD-binding oxidoreductase [Vicinamibacteria bacterium]|nr:FAD-binding oxidoreductase [Vicinamibacteria bacterium]
MLPDPRAHAAKVGRVAARLAATHGRGPVSLRKAAVPHQVPKAGDRRRHDAKLDIRDLNAILAIDPVRRIGVAESGVTFVDLVAATLRHGLVPAVVPELKTITIGGAVSGCSIESMSFRVGGFHDTCFEYEVVTGTGEVLTCGPDDLLFHMMHGSFGTLGVLTRLAFRLVPAKRFVHVTYEKHARLEDYLAAIGRRRNEPDVDFLDGIIHSPEAYVLNVGRFADAAPYTHRYDWTRVYWKSTGSRREDYLETPGYFFRYDNGVTNVYPRSAIGRLLFGRLLHSSQVLRLAQKLPCLLDDERPTVTLDVFVPVSRVPDFLAWHEREVGHYPLWCVPYRRVRDYEWIAPALFHGLDDDLFLDLAIYGMKQPQGKNVHRMIEDKLLELGGIKSLISHNYYSEDEFWSVWNRANYRAVKQRTDPANRFRDLYAKTCHAAMGRS